MVYFDEFTGTTFETSEANLIKSEILLNKKFIETGCATISDLYSELGVPSGTISEYFGWCKEDSIQQGYEWIDIDHILMSGKTHIIYSIRPSPTLGFYEDIGIFV